MNMPLEVAQAILVVAYFILLLFRLVMGPDFRYSDVWDKDEPIKSIIRFLAWVSGKSFLYGLVTLVLWALGVVAVSFFAPQ